MPVGQRLAEANVRAMHKWAMLNKTGTIHSINMPTSITDDQLFIYAKRVKGKVVVITGAS